MNKVLIHIVWFLIERLEVIENHLYCKLEHIPTTDSEGEEQQIDHMYLDYKNSLL